MKKFLTFAMVAPMASFGAIAVGERRDSDDHPARSAILGLVGACLGIEREDEEAHKELEACYGLAVLSSQGGKSLVDFHTAQTAKGADIATRRHVLRSKDLVTILSRREYRTDVWHLGALWLREAHARWSLDKIQQAMDMPYFTPYLGRRSCPLSLPLAPMIKEYRSASAALYGRYQGHDEAEKEVEFRKKLFPYKQNGQNLRLYLDRIETQEIGNAIEEGFVERQRNMRRDMLLSRKRWQFGLREEAVLFYNDRKGERD